MDGYPIGGLRSVLKLACLQKRFSKTLVLLICDSMPNRSAIP